MLKRILLLITSALMLSGVEINVRAAPATTQATYGLVQSYAGPSGSGSAGIYALSSSIGQSAAGEVSAGIYTLGGGFWGGGVIVPAASRYTVYLPVVLR